MTEQGFFSAYGTTVDDVDENPFVAPDNTYKVSVTEAGVTDFGKGGPEFFSIEYTISQGPHAGKKANHLFRMSPLTAADQEDYETQNARTLSNFKKAMLDLGLKPEALSIFNPRVHAGKLIGIKGTARVFPSKRAGYNNMGEFTREAVAAPTDSTPVNTSTPVPDAAAVSNLLDGF